MPTAGLDGPRRFRIAAPASVTSVATIVPVLGKPGRGHGATGRQQVAVVDADDLDEHRTSH